MKRKQLTHPTPFFGESIHRPQHGEWDLVDNPAAFAAIRRIDSSRSNPSANLEV